MAKERIQFEIKNFREPLSRTELTSRVNVEIEHKEGPGGIEISDVTIAYGVQITKKASPFHGAVYLGERNSDPALAFADAIGAAKARMQSSPKADEYTLQASVEAAYTRVAAPAERPAEARAGGAAPDLRYEKKETTYV